MEKAQLRNRLRQQRRGLGDAVLQANSHAICQRLWQHHWIRTAKHIALYFANDGEPDVFDLIDLASSHNPRYYLPCLDGYGRQHMVFRHWAPGDPLALNKFKIPEPVIDEPIPVWALSVVLLPLVGFDARGNRLGMGAGYYDRTLIIRRGGNKLLPRLIGIAHDFQEVAEIEPAPWDIPLDLIVTEKRIIVPRRQADETLT